MSDPKPLTPDEEHFSDQDDERRPFLRLLHFTGYRNLRALHPSKKAESLNVPVDDLDSLDRFVNQYDKYNVYVGVATRVDASRADTDACLALSALSVDIDFKDSSEAEARAHLAAFPKPPNLIVFTGGGLQCYWLLTEPLDLQKDGGAAYAKDLLVRLATALRADLKAAEPARIFRLPGTRNYKYTPSRLVGVEHSDTTRRYVLDDLIAVLPPPTSAPKSEPLPPTISDGARNDTLFKEGCRLRHLGLEEPEILAALTAINQHRCQPPLKDPEVKTIAKSCAEYAPTPSAHTDGERTVTLTPASDIRMRRAQYIWHRRLPASMIALLFGREGVGKSGVSLKLAADLSRGRLPGCYEGQPKSVLIVATEDDWSFTIAPRLKANGADMDRCFRVNVETKKFGKVEVSLPEDLPALTALVAAHDVALMILDPIISRLGKKLDTHVDAQVRQALEPLREFAESASVAVLGLIHPNKSQSGIPVDPLNTIMGSRAFSAVSRSTLFVVADPIDYEVLYLMHVKNNVGSPAPTIEFSISDTLAGFDDQGEEIHAQSITWLGERDEKERASTLLAELRKKEQRGEAPDSAQDAACEFLTACLQQKAMLASTVIAEAAKVGIAKRTLQRAVDDLGLVRVWTRDQPPKLQWGLPQQESHR